METNAERVADTGLASLCANFSPVIYIQMANP
jgi:hypothetical protein